MVGENSAEKSPLILIVDDQLDTVQELGLFLENNGYEVTYAQTGAETLQQLNAYQPDLILLDLFMPEMDGLQTCERIQANPKYQTIPILFLTASREEKHLVSAFEMGAIDYLMKPFSNLEVLTRVATQLKLRKQAQAIQQAKDQLNTIVSHVKDGLLVIDKDGIIQFVNPAASHMFQKPAAALLGHNLGQPIVTGTITNIEILRLNGELGTAEITQADAEWDGHPAFVVCLRDISDRQPIDHRNR